MKLLALGLPMLLLSTLSQATTIKCTQRAGDQPSDAKAGWEETVTIGFDSTSPSYSSTYHLAQGDTPHVIDEISPTEACQHPRHQPASACTAVVAPNPSKDLAYSMVYKCPGEVTLTVNLYNTLADGSQVIESYCQDDAVRSAIWRDFLTVDCK